MCHNQVALVGSWKLETYYARDHARLSGLTLTRTWSKTQETDRQTRMVEHGRVPKKLLEVLYQLTKRLVLTVNCLSTIQRFWALPFRLQQLQSFCVEGTARSQSLWTGRNHFMPGASRSESVCTFQSLRIQNTSRTLYWLHHVALEISCVEPIPAFVFTKKPLHPKSSLAPLPKQTTTSIGVLSMA